MDADFIHELFRDFGKVEVKRMFSGQGIYAGGVIFAIVSGGVIHLKTDDTTRAVFERENAMPLTFTKKSGQRMVTSYWRLPERLYDDPEELAQWARVALGAARAKAAAKPSKKAVSAKKKAGRKSRL
ncbi:MAG: TfoX/Sxy family protein [Pseudolabrys sp.]|nr:TfoX/Sxy family protein [Pseudolabrys sp.]MDP2295251.1 TfoX/Sxy family protein [Pseudolabrys sp.]